MNKRIYHIVNGITLYRLLVAPLLFLLIITGRIDIFRWLLPLSFLSDALDGYLARRYKVTSVLGAKLDSIADDLTLLVAILGLFLLRPEFVIEQNAIIIPLLVLYLTQTALALFRYRKISGFHTYLAKGATVLQGAFLILVFFTGPIDLLFYATALVTALDLLEEVVLVFLLPHWRANVKGLYWVWKKKTLHAV